MLSLVVALTGLIVLAWDDGGTDDVDETPSASRTTGISEVDRAIALLESHDIAGLSSIAAKVRQTCPPPDGAGVSTVPGKNGEAIPCERGLGKGTAITAGDDGWITSEDVFQDSTQCASVYHRDEEAIRDAIDGALSRGGTTQSSVYGVGRQSAINKNADGYVILLTPGATPSGDADVTRWFLLPEGELIAIQDGCGIGDAQTTALRGALNQPLLDASE